MAGLGRITKDVLLAAGVFLIYFLFARLGLLFTVAPTNIAAVWPASGLQLALLVLAGRDRRVLVVIAIFASNLVSNLLVGTTFQASVGFGAANICEGLVAVAILERFASPDIRFTRLKDTLVFLVLVVVAGNAVTALFGATVARFAFGVDLWESWKTWWLADGSGMLLFTPFPLEWAAEGRVRLRNPDYGRLLEGLAAFAILFLIFRYHVYTAAGTDRVHMAYLLLPLVIWIVIRLETPGTVTINLGLSCTLLFFGLRQSPGTWVPILEIVNQGQLFACITAGSTLLLSAAFSERSRAESELKSLNESLERKVAERSEAAESKALRLEASDAAQRRLVSELRDANAELDSFSASVSHDLRAPLRRMAGFSKALLEDEGHGLSDRGRIYLAQTLEAATRMESVLDALMALSRVSRAELHLGEFELSAVGREVAAELRERHPHRTVVFVAPERLDVTGDLRMLRIVLQNLLDNAWKFTALRPDARVELGSLEGPGGIEYFVRDNGAGFDMAFAGELFRPFHRLHPEDEFPGTGVGLATVRRVISRHGGRILAEGVPGGGAAFYFTLERSS